MPNDEIVNNSCERIHVIAIVLLHHLIRLSWKILIPVGTPEPEGMLILTPTENRRSIVDIEWSKCHHITINVFNRKIMHNCRDCQTFGINVIDL